MTTIATLTVKLLGDIAQYSAAMGKAEQQSQTASQTIGKNLQNVGKSMTQAGQALTLGLTLPILGFAGSSVKAAMDSENAIAALNAVIKSTGGAAGVSAESVINYAAAMQKVTMFDDEAIIGGQSMLLTFTKIGSDVFPAASTAVLNMAQKFGSVQEASIQVGKALNSPIEGVSALRRVGVMLSDQQEAQVKAFMDVNDISSAQRVILNELSTEFGGLALAAGATTEGKLVQFQHALNDIQELIGGVLLPYILQFKDFLTQLMDAFKALSPEQQNWIVLIGLGVAAIGPLLVIVGTLIGAIGAIIPVITAVAGAISFPLIAIIAAVGAAIALLYVAWQNNWGGIQSIAFAATQFITAIVRAFQSAFSGDWYAFGQHLREAWDFAWAEIAKINWFELGKNVILGILNGITTMRSALINGMINTVRAAVDAVRGFLYMHSPSGLMRDEIGKNMALGLIAGWEINLKPTALQPALASAVSMPSYNIPTANYGPATSGGNGDSQIIDLLQRILGKKDIDEVKLARLLRDAVLQVTG